MIHVGLKKKCSPVTELANIYNETIDLYFHKCETNTNMLIFSIHEIKYIYTRQVICSNGSSNIKIA